MNIATPSFQFRPPLTIGPSEPRASDDASLEIRVGYGVIVLFLLVVFGWAATARLDAAAFAAGSIGVEGHRQSVQHRDGGIVSRINVHDGSVVRVGDVLISLAPAEVEATERAMASQVIGLQAQRARLQAEQTGAARIAPPSAFAMFTGQDRSEADRALALQQNELEARRAAVIGQKRVIGQRSEQLAKTIGGFRREIGTTGEQSRLIGEELDGLESLAARGFVSMNRVREMKRARANLAGQSGELEANVGRSESQIGEMRMQALTLDTARMESIAKDVREIEFQLNDLLPKLQAVRDRLAQTRIRAPAAGRVVGLTIFTVGGVVAPGQRLLDIVPQERRLMIDAKLLPSDSDGVHVGQRAEIKMTAIHDRSLPVVEGTVERLSADSLTEERTGAQYFAIEVSVPQAEVERIATLRGADGAMRAGQPVQVVIPLRKRTALQYLLDPLLGAFWRSFHER